MCDEIKDTIREYDGGCDSTLLPCGNHNTWCPLVTKRDYQGPGPFCWCGKCCCILGATCPKPKENLKKRSYVEQEGWVGVSLGAMVAKLHNTLEATQERVVFLQSLFDECTLAYQRHATATKYPETPRSYGVPITINEVHESLDKLYEDIATLKNENAKEYPDGRQLAMIYSLVENMQLRSKRYKAINQFIGSGFEKHTFSS